MTNALLSPYAIFLILSGAGAFFFTVFATLSSVYRFETAGLDPLQLMLIGAVLEATVFLFEVPTGVVADLYSRRRSIIIGMFLISAGFVLEGALPLFATMLLAQVIWGIGATFESGATDAWIADELGEGRVPEAFLRGAQVGTVASLAGIAAAVALGSVYLGLPLVIGGLGYAATAVFLLMFMSEMAFTPTPSSERTTIAAVRDTLTGGLRLVRERPVLITILAIAVILGASSETFDRLWEAHFLSNLSFPAGTGLEPVAWFGIINAGALMLSIAVTEIVRRFVKTDSHLAVARALMVINTLLLASMIGFGLAGHFMTAVAFYWSSVLLRRVNRPLFSAWLNQSLTPRIRATMFSFANQMDAFGQIAGGPLLGLLASVAGLRSALATAGLLLLPATVLYLRTIRKPPGAPQADGSAPATGPS